jgi:hypothetical protein
MEQKKITKYQNFLSEDLYNHSIGAASHLLSRGENIFCTNRWWNEGIVKDSFPVFIHNINKESELYNNILNTIQDKTGLFVNDHEIMFYYWTRFSYIPWHEDVSYGGALTIYLNEVWHEDFGGYFLYEDKQDIKAIIPQKNLAILQNGGLRHCTTPVNFNGTVRITIQVFLDKEKN